MEKIKNRIVYGVGIILIACISVFSSCSKNDIAQPPLISLQMIVGGDVFLDENQPVSAPVGTRIDYEFHIKSFVTIAGVKTIRSMILNDQVKTIDETLTGGFTDKMEDVIRGTMFVETIGTEVKIIVTDVDGNESQKAITVIPEF